MGQAVNKGVEIIVPVAFLTVECAECGSLEYHVKTLPQVHEGEQKGKVYAIECAGCENVMNLDDNRFLVSKKPGKISFNPLIKPKGVE